MVPNHSSGPRTFPNNTVNMTIVLKEAAAQSYQWVIELSASSPRQLMYLLSDGTFAEILNARDPYAYQPHLDKNISDRISLFPSEETAVAAARKAAARYKKATKSRFNLTAIPVTNRAVRQLVLHEAYRSPFLYDTQVEL